MFKSKILPKILSAVALVSVLIAAISSSACFPIFVHQPKIPKSLIKTE